jgi:hypothetical protein
MVVGYSWLVTEHLSIGEGVHKWDSLRLVISVYWPEPIVFARVLLVQILWDESVDEAGGFAEGAQGKWKSGRRVQ